MVSVYVMFNGAAAEHSFNDNLEGFMVGWNNQILDVGYFTGKDAEGKIVTINPSNCGAIDIREIKN